MSKEYGYIGKEVTQAFRDNKGIFTPQDIIELDQENKWTNFGQLELIQTQTFTTTQNVDFTSIEENTFNILFASVLAERQSTSNESIGIQFFESGTLETGSVYDYAYQNGEAGGTFNESKNNSSNRLLATHFVDAGDDKYSYNYFYNLGDSTKFSFQTMHSTTKQGTNYKFRFGSGVLPQKSQVDGIRFTSVTGTMTGTISLYGLRFS